jgi:L-fucose mutarotase/ribose pyranase (RbsD/FucU family)
MQIQSAMIRRERGLWEIGAGYTVLLVDTAFRSISLSDPSQVVHVHAANLFRQMAANLFLFDAKENLQGG